jgi:outer membrane protein assembly factor BamA
MNVSIATAIALLTLGFPPALHARTINCRPARLTPGALLLEQVSIVPVSGVNLKGLNAVVGPLKGRWNWALPCRRRLSAELVQAVRRALRDQGYWRASASVALKRVGAAARARVSIRLNGPRSRVGALDVEGVTRQLRFKLLKKVALRSGAVIRAKVVERDTTTLNRYFMDRGHAFAVTRVRTRIHANGRYVDVTFVPTPGPVFKVKAVNVMGASKTGASLVRRAVGPLNRRKYSHGRLLAAIGRLRRTGAFYKVNFKSRKVGPGWVTVVVRVREKPLR